VDVRAGLGSQPPFSTGAQKAKLPSRLVEGTTAISVVSSAEIEEGAMGNSSTSIGSTAGAIKKLASSFGSPPDGTKNSRWSPAVSCTTRLRSAASVPPAPMATPTTQPTQS
jgi:hypothetical protein